MKQDKSFNKKTDALDPVVTEKGIGEAEKKALNKIKKKFKKNE